MSALEVETPVLYVPFHKYSLWLSVSPFSCVARWLRVADLLWGGDAMLPHCVPVATLCACRLFLIEKVMILTLPLC